MGFVLCNAMQAMHMMMSLLTELRCVDRQQAREERVLLPFSTFTSSLSVTMMNALSLSLSPTGSRRMMMRCLFLLDRHRRRVGAPHSIASSSSSSLSRMRSTRTLSSARPLPSISVDAASSSSSLSRRQPLARVVQQVVVDNNKKKKKAEEEGAPSASSLSSVKDDAESPQTLSFMDRQCPVTSVLQIVTPQDDVPRGVWPVFRLMDENGRFRNPAHDAMIPEMEHSSRIASSSSFSSPTINTATTTTTTSSSSSLLQQQLLQDYPFQSTEIQQSKLLQAAKHDYSDTQSKDSLARAVTQMMRLREMDDILLNAQRQGRISFYMTCRGEEAIHMGAASALDNADPIFAQYREQGLLMWRGFTLEQFCNQCFSNGADLGKGRQMPVHYGSRALNFHTISSPLGTQLPQAVGAAYRLKLAKQPNVVLCVFGDGCASTTDFHSALNFAATLKAPVVFLCRNNGYAISTPVTDQYAGDGIVSRAPGYGMAAIRVDGNDLFAMHAVVRQAKQYALEHSAPVLIEAMTYRQGHHSTSDDSTRYRSQAEVQGFEEHVDPLIRMGHFMRRYTDMSTEQQAEIRSQQKVAVLKAMGQAERLPPPSLHSLFEDVYYEMPRHLQEQQEQLRQHMAKYPKRYKTSSSNHK